MEYPKTCAFCERPFTGWSSSCLYCSARCRKNAQARRRYNRTKERNLCVWCFTKPVEGGYHLCAECRAKSRDYRYNMSPEQKTRAYQKTREWIKTQPNYYRKMHERTRDKLRRQVFEHYGNQCACCGLDDWRFMTIDHIGGGGNKHRRATFNGKLVAGMDLYRWLRKNNYPDGFQLLCYNCNCAQSRFGGVCPHQSDKIETEVITLDSV